MAYDIRPLSIAEVLDRGFRVLRDHFRLLVGIAAWAWIPYGVLLALSESNKTFAGLAMLLFLIVSPIMYAALIVAVGEVYLDQPATIAGSYASTRALAGARLEIAEFPSPDRVAFLEDVLVMAERHIANS